MLPTDIVAGSIGRTVASAARLASWRYAAQPIVAAATPYATNTSTPAPATRTIVSRLRRQRGAIAASHVCRYPRRSHSASPKTRTSFAGSGREVSPSRYQLRRSGSLASRKVATRSATIPANGRRTTSHTTSRSSPSHHRNSPTTTQAPTPASRSPRMPSSVMGASAGRYPARSP